MRRARAIVRRTGLRAHLEAARKLVERNALATVGRRPNPTRGRILCYHSVGSPVYRVNDVSPRQFRRHINLALSWGYRIVPASDIALTGGQPKDLAITFDDGVRSVDTHAAPFLADLGVPWTMFVVTEWAAGKGWWHPEEFMRWDEIERLPEKGAIIASHSATHRNFGRLSADEARYELFESRSALQSRLGIDAAEFAIPFGRARDWSDEAHAIALEAGYQTIYAASENRRARGTVPRTFITGVDNDRVFRGVLEGAFDEWEEWF
ncbi:MAG: polysaccharide deacetylase family protein [Chloroflexota bacterium]